MNSQPKLFTVTLALLLALVLASIYLLTYSARIESGDELRIFDGATSWVRFGDWERDESLWLGTSTTFSHPNYPSTRTASDELVMASLVSGLVRVSDNLESIGTVHSAWLFNLSVCVLCAVVFLFLGLHLGYEIRVAWLGALLFGIATTTWFYSKTLFREPIVMLLLLLSAYAFLVVRQSKLTGKMFGVVLGVGAFVLSILIKESSIFALLALILVIFPNAPVFQKHWLIRASLVLLSVLLIAITTFAYSQQVNQVFFQFTKPLLDFINTRIPLSSNIESVQVAFHTYMFSIGGSIWGTSPILILGVWGAYLLIQKRQHRWVWIALFITVLYAIGHALLTGIHWFGGLSLPPRFMIPVLPFLMVLVLPVIDLVIHQRRLWQMATFACVAGASITLQVIFSVSFLRSYTDVLLPPQAQNVGEWSEGLNQLVYTRAWLLPQSWDTLGLDLAWRRSSAVDWASLNVVLIVVALVCTIALFQWRKYSSWLLGISMLLWGVCGLGTLAGLRAIYLSDPVYQSNNVSLLQALDTIEQQAQPNEILLLSNRTYDFFLMNHYRGRNARPFILGTQPGEAPSGDQQAEVVSNQAGDLLTWFTMRAIDKFNQTHNKLWLLTNTSQYMPWATRPVERYLVENYYLLSEAPLNNSEVRLLSFNLTDLPRSDSFSNPDILTDLRFDNIQLMGVNLPNGLTYEHGQAIPVVFWWRTDTPINDEVVFSWFVVPKDGSHPPVQALDSQAQGGFMPTTRWQAGQIIRDRRALSLPKDLPAGEYEIWVLAYRFVNGAPQRLTVFGTQTLPDNIGLLPITFQISAP
jgi:hypothetical protein